MAYSFWVLVARQSLPDFAELQNILRLADLPLELDTPWDWQQDSGWCPMRWQDVASGCEVELSSLSRDEVAALRKAGLSVYDAAVVITVRGEASAQASACFGAALAVATSGCISEEEDTYLPHDRALQWARDCVADAEARR